MIHVAQPDAFEPGLYAQAGRAGDHVVIGTNASTAHVTVEAAREFAAGLEAIIARIEEGHEPNPSRQPGESLSDFESRCESYVREHGR